MRFSTTLTCQYDTPFSPFSPAELDQGLAWAAESGFDGVELCISHYRDLDVQALKRKLDSHGLYCSTLSTGQARTLENLSLLAEDPQAVQACQQRLMQHMEAAALLGSKVTLGLLRGLGDQSRTEEQHKLLAARMQPLLEAAERHRVVILLEIINRYETALLNTTAQTVEFIRQLGSPDCLKILWDVFHANIEDPDFAGSIALMGDLLGHVHMADTNRMFPGYGHMPFDGITRALRAAGFSEYMSFECFNQPSVRTVRERSGQFISHLRSLA